MIVVFPELRVNVKVHAWPGEFSLGSGLWPLFVIAVAPFASVLQLQEGRGHAPREERDRYHIHPWERGHQFVRGIGPHRHEPARAKRDLPAIASQDVQPDGGDGIDQKGQHDCVGPVIIDHDGHDQKCDYHNEIVAIPVKRDRKGLSVGDVGGFEIPRFTVKHVAPDL